MPKWEEDVDVPQVAKLKSAGSLQADVSKLATLAKNAEAPKGAVSETATISWSATVIEDKSVKNAIGEGITEKTIQEQAVRSADNVAASIFGDTVTLISGDGTPGWYEGSVPSFSGTGRNGNKAQSFPSAPTMALNSEEEYRNLWLRPFIDRLRIHHKKRVIEKHEGKVTATHEPG